MTTTTDLELEFKKLFQFLAKAGGADLFAAKVVSVDKDQYTCDVTRIDNDAERHDVRFKAEINGHQSGVVCFPEVGSTILAATINGRSTDCVVLVCERIESYRFMTTGGFTMEVTSGGDTLFNGGSLGGLVKISPLVDDLGKIKAWMQMVNSIFTSWIPISETALKTASAAFTNLPLPALSDLENSAIKQ